MKIEVATVEYEEIILELQGVAFLLYYLGNQSQQNLGDGIDRAMHTLSNVIVGDTKKLMAIGKIEEDQL